MAQYNKLVLYCPNIWDCQVLIIFKILIHFSSNELDVFIQKLVIQKY